jgi:serine/threonine protein kinase/WD40 repeat protein
MIDDTSASSDDAHAQVLGRFLDELHGAERPDELLECYAAEFPELLDKFRDLARMDVALGPTGNWDGAEGSKDTCDASILEHPPRFGPYRVVRYIGRGGMGEVYEAVEDSLERSVAVKTIRRDHNTDAAKMERFHRERMALARMHDSHIIPILAAGQDVDLLYYAMPFIRGASLSQVIRTARSQGSIGSGNLSSSFEQLIHQSTRDTGGPQVEPPDSSSPADSLTSVTLNRGYLNSVVRLMAAVAQAVHHAHRLGITHRDLKPSNIMVEPPEQPWVLDFGLARFKEELPLDRVPDGSEGSKACVLTVGLVGTPAYMAPEQLTPRAVVDARSDVWSLGVTLYELLTLRRPFRTKDEILAARPVRPRGLMRGLPRDIEAIALKALRKEPVERYETAEQLADDLRRWLRGEPVMARPARAPRRVWYWSRRNKGWAAAIFAAVVGSSIFAGARLVQARAEAERFRIETMAAQERERAARHSLALQNVQRIRLGRHISGWSKDYQDQIQRARLEGGDRDDDGQLQGQAAAGLAGLDATKAKTIEHGATSVAWAPDGERMLVEYGGIVDRPLMPKGVAIWDRATDRTSDPRPLDRGIPAFRPDGRAIWLAPVPEKVANAAALFDVGSGQELRRFATPRDAGAVVISAWNLTRDGARVGVILQPIKARPDGGAVLGGEGRPIPDGDRTGIIVWNGTTGAEVARIEHEAMVDLIFAPDGRYLAAWDKQNRVTVWTLPDGRPYATFHVGHTAIEAIGFGRDPARRADDGPDATRWVLAAGDAGGTVTIWNLADRGVRCICRGAAYDIKGLDFSPDGTILAAVGRSAQLWDVATGGLLLSLKEANHITSVAFAPDGRRLAVASVDSFGPGGVNVWDLDPGRGVETLQGLSGRVEKVIVSPDGRLIAALANNWEIGVWDYPGGRLRWVFQVPPGAFTDNAGLAFDAEGRRLAFSAWEHAQLWDLRTGRIIKSWDLPPALNEAPAFSGPDRLLLFREETQSGRLPPTTQAPPEVEPRVARLYDLLADPKVPIREVKDFNLKVLYIVASRGGEVFAIEGVGTKEGRRLRKLMAIEGPTGKELWSSSSGRAADASNMIFDPTGQLFLYKADDAGSSNLLDTATGRLRGTMLTLPYSVSPDAARWLLMEGGSTDRPEMIAIHERGRNRASLRFVTDDLARGTGAFSPDGRHVVLCSQDGRVIVCDLNEMNHWLSGVGLGW